MRLHTESLALRPLAASDVDALAVIMADPEVCRYLGDGRPRTRDRVERSVGFARRMWDERGFGPFAMELEGRLIGVCLLLPLPRTGTDPGDFDARGPEIEIGYWVAKEAWGNGYATEAARAVLGWVTGGDGPGLGRVLAVTNPENAASRRVLEKIGMRSLGESGAYYGATTSLYEFVRPVGS